MNSPYGNYDKIGNRRVKFGGPRTRVRLLAALLAPI